MRTLRNAVTQDALHHAYLFVGSRGTGKTSMAKILAACLNCDGAATHPTIEPCGVCDSCVSIHNAHSMDVIEMDAASNNSVDDIRELRESVSFAPVSGKYKVYILDEAHMLTTAAWNAFLKTLEEPPPSTIFVLATTEAAKVLPTVVDRCHRFDFTRPTVEQLAAVVQRVAGKEAIDIPPDAVALLARHATGSFRDALGTLEQLVTYTGATGDDGSTPRILTDDVLAVLGVAGADLLFGALEAIAAHDARAALFAAAELAHTGRDVSQFVRDIETHARELMLVQTLGSVPAEIAVTPDRDARLVDQAARVAPSDVVRLIDLLAAALRAMKDGADPRTQLELALVKAATPQVDASAKALMARLERLERALAASGRAASPAGAVGTPPSAPLRSSLAPREPLRGDVPTAPASAAAPAAEPDVGAVDAPTAPASAGAPVAGPDVGAVDAPTVSAAAETELSLPGLEELWPAVLDVLAVSNGQLAVGLRDARPIALVGREVTVGFDRAHAFQCRIADQPVNCALLGESIRAVTGLDARLTIELHDLAGLQPAVAAPTPPTEDEWVDRLKHEFDAEEIVPD